MKIRSMRHGLHTDFIDLNKVKKQQALESIEANIGAFNKKGGRFRQNNQDLDQMMSPRSRAKMELLAKKEQENYQQYLKERGQRQIVGQPGKNLMLNHTKIMSREGAVLQRSGYDN